MLPSVRARASRRWWLPTGAPAASRWASARTSSAAGVRAPAGLPGRGSAARLGRDGEDRLADVLQRRPVLDEDLRRHAPALADDAQHDVLGADVVVLEPQRLAQRQLHDLLRPRGERDVPEAGPVRVAGADDLLDAGADAVEAVAERAQRAGGRHVRRLGQDAEQQVLRADVVVARGRGPAPVR